ncbi:hypothetical protein, unlikely [Trypanosoma brucei gambiense DAL972]|uniref:Uncharacterized protein n=1 Tax=Trypanosoma brucei gambiense (strain MHOM/CI/86/DAL972) TaxID=679716 RepID=C9ZMD5_TRYB9|nr:hypothetical protein, unlikely [Trypanosoma brucei gambiense DAL972]CBH10808.1 hypothetical protein, unlikely [Trypanosoma brucei gambiense DAL972]|eukprot:XP_011773096.1 hypothetical protein, unlikely [Trypanosoma brucei gambiense DAL972]
MFLLPRLLFNSLKSSSEISNWLSESEWGCGRINVKEEVARYRLTVSLFLFSFVYVCVCVCLSCFPSRLRRSGDVFMLWTVLARVTYTYSFFFYTHIHPPY